MNVVIDRFKGRHSLPLQREFALIEGNKAFDVIPSFFASEYFLVMSLL